ncbi:DUF305 domain-containing protein [Nocardioides sp. T2.26MG-1]|uniref:DUF305 domain-containing protein n=1 Tax=Nocardioides sp. T2.26MG-1 TaxID=3041166 RepID=UPI0024779ECF|nr:DUF305 domain-containing protein [Nocardioides sp. T2.26MG-1]CAI9403767.1 hypothetical protein HIDPHFAB_04047 [Nocardioides sp. T2.26MG-1]
MLRPGRPVLRRAATALAAGALAATVLAGCGTDVAPTTARASADPGHNQFDVAFAAEMVPHHEQGLQLVDLAGQREVSTGFTELTTRIVAEQTADLEELEAWLTAWDGPVPPAPDEPMDDDTMTTRSKTGAMQGLMRSRMGPWALDGADLDLLARCRAAAFEGRWLRMMIRHHQGAISMARHELTHGQYPPAIALAEEVVTTQQAEVEEMQALLQD